MDGGHKSVATGLGSYRSLRHHHNVHTMQHSRARSWTRTQSELHHSQLAHGQGAARGGVKVFQIETTLNNDTFAEPLRLPAKREWEWTARDQALFVGAEALDRPDAGQGSARGLPAHRARRYAMTGVQAGEVEAVHAMTLEHVHRQQLVEVEGQTDILTIGLPYICPYNVNSIMNPILVMCLGLGYFFNLYRGKPLVREGGVLIMNHPTPWEFHPVHHPSYIDFFEQVLAETTDPARDRGEVREAASPRTSGTATCTGRATPTTASTRSTCGTGARTRCSTSGDVIIVGGDPAAVPAAGLPARGHAARRAGDGRGGRRPRAVDHPPPQPAAVLREVEA